MWRKSKQGTFLTPSDGGGGERSKLGLAIRQRNKIAPALIYKQMGKSNGGHPTPTGMGKKECLHAFNCINIFRSSGEEEEAALQSALQRVPKGLGLELKEEYRVTKQLGQNLPLPLM